MGFQTFEAIVDSLGTCHNLAFGFKEFECNKFIRGGAEAGPNFESQSSIQIQMTNMRSNIPVIFEDSCTVIVSESSWRKGSGGF